MALRRWCCGVLLGVLWVGAAPARAGTAADDPDVESAQRHFQAASAHYDARRYAEAIREFEATRQLRASPMIDYNIARCHDRLEHWAEAIVEYERYIAGDPNSDDARLAHERVAKLRARLPARIEPAPPPVAVAPHPVVVTPVAPPPPASPRKSRAWVAGVVVAVVVVAGAGVGVGLGIGLGSGPSKPALTDDAITITSFH